MLFVNVKLNKITFVIMLLSEIICLYVAYKYLLFSLYILIPFALCFISLKYFVFRLCYKVLNQQNLLFTFFAVLMSILFEVLVCMRAFNSLFVGFNLLTKLPSIIVLVEAPISLFFKLIFAISCIVLRRFVKFGIDIPVSTLEKNYRGKIDEWANKIPGL